MTVPSMYAQSQQSRDYIHLGGRTIVIETPIGIAVSPASVSVGPSGQVNFSASVMGGTPFLMWSVSGPPGVDAGIITAAGVYTAPSIIPSVQQVTVTVTSPSDKQTGSATVTLTPGAISVSVSPSSVTLAASQTQQFTASVAGTTNTAVSWSRSPAVGALSPSGIYTAPPAIDPNQAVITIIASSVADPSKSAAATVNLSTAASLYFDSSAATLPNAATCSTVNIVSSLTTTTWTVASTNTAMLTPELCAEPSTHAD